MLKNNSNRKRIIIDVDTGVDDANAILFALLSNELDIEAITTVHGNVDVDTATRNALYVIERLGHEDIPVYRGAARSMIGPPPRDATILHGEDGLGNTGLAKPTINRQKACATSALIRHVLAAPGEITILVLGPQTNIALAIRAEPDFAAAVKEIVLIGGRVTRRGNVLPFVTLNIGEDPEAAHIVLQETEIPVTMLTQEVAFQVMYSLEDIDRIAGYDTDVARFAAEISRFYIEQQMRFLGSEAGSVPNLATVAYIMRPDLFVNRSMWVDIETTHGYARGAVIVGSPSYLQYDQYDRRVLINRPAVGNRRENTYVSDEVPLPGRMINVPSDMRPRTVEEWYEQLLSDLTQNR
jgi:inosine-uridine nucleoside N-ribohydrolase